MSFDAIADTRVSAFAKDSARKNKNSRLAKLKRDKVDARREQSLSQGKNKDYKMGINDSLRAISSSIPKDIEGTKTQVNQCTNPRKDKHEILLLSTFDSESGSWMSSTVCRNLVCITNSGSGSSCSGSCSSSYSEGDRDNGFLDDWETIADSLTGDNNSNGTSDVKQLAEPKIIVTQSNSCRDKTHRAANSNGEAVEMARRSTRNSRAWCPDDSYRPASFPSLSKSSDRPLSCPICCEDLDVTDSNFLPCPCGFQLCLFCHKRILEVDARCPGCRKQYDSLNPDVGEEENEPVLEEF